ncbi:hypothetical protein [Vibrio bivalvicida]|uniref:Uncharacterized protein n=1 Tax=Vibrio bivalvicida TaxID=1276888 RepID=A0A177XWZ3_9VIBR|nr:hypothetical protein [Vibrio bivalvicida]OAJ93142.1 hypothetical protein APB76_16330 [Vibrio bivalvicida]
MYTWKTAFFTCLVLMMGSTLYLGFALIDAGISYTYQQESLKTAIKSNEVLSRVVLASSKAYTQEDLLHLLREIDPNAFIVQEKDQLIIGDITFKFENNVLVEVVQYGI